MGLGIELRYRIVDVFSDRPLAGNALCVVLDPCPEPVMQAVAREANLSETTFPVVVADDAYEMRIFTPIEELPFAGHPSLGTAWTLGPGRWTQTTSGAVTIAQGAEVGRPCTIEVEAVAGAIRVGGRVAACAEGRFTL